MIQWLSGYYAQSPAIIAKAMAPKIYKSKKNKFNVPAKNLKNINANFNDKNINEYCDKIWHSTQKIQLYIGVPEPKFYTTLMSKCCGEGKQVLLVYPEIHMIDDAIDIAQYMVKLYDTKLLLCSIAPRVTTYYNAKKNEWPVFRNLDISAKNITIVS